MKTLILLLVTLAKTIDGSSCGNSLVPYSFEALPNGQPVLGCARPTCFGWSPNGQPLPTNANFSRISHHADGYLRLDPASIPPFKKDDPRVYGHQQARCEEAFQSLSCASEDQWVGGIAPLLDVNISITAYQCCTFKPVSLATERGVAVIPPGHIFIGGEVMEDGKQYAFDYISNVEKKFDENNVIYYEIDVRRMPCLSLHNFDATYGKVHQSAETIREFNYASRKVVAHQVPNVEVGPDSQIPLSGAEVEETADAVNIEDPETATEVIVEEIIAQPGFLQPEQIPQPPVVPQAGFQAPPPPAPPLQGPVPAQFLPPQQPSIFLPQPAQAPAAAAVPYQPYSYFAPSNLQFYYCFTDDTIVNVYGGTQKRMDELQVGDWIEAVGDEVGSFEFIPVTYWLHKMPEQVAEFRRIELEDGTFLKITDLHHIYKTECLKTEKVNFKDVNHISVYANEIKVGDCLYKKNKDDIHTVKVSNVTLVKQTGIYSPMTATGRIVVNDIHSSCHTVIDNQSLQHSFFTWVDHLNSYIGELLGNHEKRDVPSGMSTLVQMMELVLPKHFMQF